VALVVHPGHAEDDLSLRLAQARQDRHVVVFRVALLHNGQRVEYLVNRLMELGLAGIAGEDRIERGLEGGFEHRDPFCAQGALKTVCESIKTRSPGWERPLWGRWCSSSKRPRARFAADQVNGQVYAQTGGPSQRRSCEGTVRAPGRPPTAAPARRATGHRAASPARRSATRRSR